MYSRRIHIQDLKFHKMQLIYHFTNGGGGGWAGAHSGPFGPMRGTFGVKVILQGQDSLKTVKMTIEFI